MSFPLRIVRFKADNVWKVHIIESFSFLETIPTPPLDIRLAQRLVPAN